MTETVDVAEERRQVLRDALDVLAARERPTDPKTRHLHDSRFRWLEIALTDHHGEPLAACGQEGRECVAVQLARQIVAGEA